MVQIALKYTKAKHIWLTNSTSVESLADKVRGAILEMGAEPGKPILNSLTMHTEFYETRTYAKEHSVTYHTLVIECDIVEEEDK